VHALDARDLQRGASGLLLLRRGVDLPVERHPAVFDTRANLPRRDGRLGILHLLDRLGQRGIRALAGRRLRRMAPYMSSSIAISSSSCR
jgi:hypothetical protein